MKIFKTANSREEDSFEKGLHNLQNEWERYKKMRDDYEFKGVSGVARSIESLQRTLFNVHKESGPFTWSSKGSFSANDLDKAFEGYDPTARHSMVSYHDGSHWFTNEGKQVMDSFINNINQQEDEIGQRDPKWSQWG